MTAIINKYAQNLSELKFIEQLLFDMNGNIYTYKGCIKEGLPFGPGIYTQCTGVTYEGEYNSMGLMHGPMIWTSANKNVKYIYNFDNGNVKSE